MASSRLCACLGAGKPAGLRQPLPRKTSLPFDLSLDEFVQKETARLTPEAVRVGGAERRELDAMDGAPFTMYKIFVDGEADLLRRYSQFRELRHALLVLHDGILPRAEADEEAPFPPKVLFGKLGLGVVEARRLALHAWLRMLLRQRFHEGSHVYAETLCAFLERGPGPEVGAAAPRMCLRDLQGCVFDAAAVDKHCVVVYAVGSRYTFQQLTAFLEPAMATLLQTHPDAPVLAVSVADLRIVPKEYRKVVEPFLRRLDDKNKAEALRQRRAAEPAKHALLPATFFVPDYEGDVIEQLGAADANWTFRVVVAAGGVIHASIQSRTEFKEAALIRGVEAAMDHDRGRLWNRQATWVCNNQLQNVLYAPQGTGSQLRGCVELQPRGDGVEVLADVATDAVPEFLGLALQASRAVPLRLSLALRVDGRPEQRMLHRLRIEAMEDAPVARFQVPVSVPGTYVFTVEMDPGGPLAAWRSSMTVRYGVYAAPVMD